MLRLLPLSLSLSISRERVISELEQAGLECVNEVVDENEHWRMEKNCC
jgi:hypothetical protein